MIAGIHSGAVVSTRAHGRLLRRLVACLLALSVIVVAMPVMARGSVKLVKTTVKEDKKGRWKLKFTIDYGKKPHIGHVPMVFSFKQTAIYERYIDDNTGKTPATRTVPVPNAEPNNLPVDVGFSNAKGEMFRVTKFAIKLSRANDFEAGEYELTVKESQSGRKIGGKIRIRLQGNNKVINRGSLDFGSGAPKPKPKADADAPKPDDAGDDNGPTAAEDMGPDLSDIPDVEDDDEPVEKPDAVEPKQGGCGCEVAGAPPTSEAGALLLLLGAGLVFARRRVRS